eukprot:COSAG01_NODE_4127_length_5326_cov_3.238569_6_plen_53_part_00
MAGMEETTGAVGADGAASPSTATLDFGSLFAAAQSQAAQPKSGKRKKKKKKR